MLSTSEAMIAAQTATGEGGPGTLRGHCGRILQTGKRRVAVDGHRNNNDAILARFVRQGDECDTHAQREDSPATAACTPRGEIDEPLASSSHTSPMEIAQTKTIEHYLILGILCGRICASKWGKSRPGRPCVHRQPSRRPLAHLHERVLRTNPTSAARHAATRR